MCTWTCLPTPVPPSPTCYCPPVHLGSAKPSCPPSAPWKTRPPWVQFRQSVVRPLHESRPDLEIIFDLATRLGVGHHFFDGNIEAAWNYQLVPSGLTVQRLRAHPVGLPVAAQTRYQKYAEIEAQTGQPRGFQTPTRKVELYATRFARAGYAPLPVYQEPAASPLSRVEV